jgi:hypothetical protein
LANVGELGWRNCTPASRESNTLCVGRNQVPRFVAERSRQGLGVASSLRNKVRKATRNDLGLAHSGHGLQFGSPAADGNAARKEKAPRLIRVKGALPSNSQELLAQRVDSRLRVVNGTGGLRPGTNGPEELEFRRRMAACAIEIGNYSAAMVEDENTRRNQQNCCLVNGPKAAEGENRPARLYLPTGPTRRERTSRTIAKEERDPILWGELSGLCSSTLRA